MRRVKLSFAAGVEVEFTDRDRALQQVVEWAEEGTRFPVVVFGPEGCGKTAWLKQAAEMLRELGYEAIYVDPMHKEFIVHRDIKELVGKFVEAASEAAGVAEAKLASLAVTAVRWFMGRRKRKAAVLVDDAFQAIGLDKAAMYVKSLLGLTEYPPEGCEKVVAVATTSEGLSRGEIGRHRWAEITPMWNMGRRGFEELYEKLPGSKPSAEEAWRFTGGNPYALARLLEFGWAFDKAVEVMVEGRKLSPFTASLSADERAWLLEAVEDPDSLFTRERMPLLNKLVELNLVVDAVPERRPYLWIDEPPPPKDLELGVGRDVAWQSPLHREAVRRALKGRK
jgi:energy-coupling factor transporter ATP-binding protein EcfA2